MRDEGLSHIHWDSEVNLRQADHVVERLREHALRWAHAEALFKQRLATSRNAGFPEMPRAQPAALDDSSATAAASTEH
jgi:hypothetical protein